MEFRHSLLQLLSDTAGPPSSSEGVDSCFPVGSGWECVKFFPQVVTQKDAGPALGTFFPQLAPPSGGW